MVKSKIFTIHTSNDHIPIGPDNLEGDTFSPPAFNRKRFLPGWEVKEYVFYQIPGKKKNRIPDSANLIGGGLAIRSDKKDKLFPFPSDTKEFLPIRVGQQDWFIVNCLELVADYDRDESILYRGLNGEIYMVPYLVIKGASSDFPEFFVIDDSNRAVIFALQSFVDRYTHLGLEGLTFREVGQVTD